MWPRYTPCNRMGRTYARVLSERGGELLQQFPPPVAPVVQPRPRGWPPVWQWLFAVLGLSWGLFEISIIRLQPTSSKNGFDFLNGVFLLCTVFTVLLPSLLLCLKDRVAYRVLLGVLSGLMVLSVAVGVLLALLTMLIGGSNAVLAASWLFVRMVAAGSVVRVLLLIPLIAALVRSRTSR